MTTDEMNALRALLKLAMEHAKHLTEQNNSLREMLEQRDELLRKLSTQKCCKADSTRKD